MIRNRSTEDFNVQVSIPGTQTAATNKFFLEVPFAGRLKAIKAILGAAGVTGSQVVDVNKNGTTIFSGAGKITFGATTAPTYAALTADPTEFVKGDNVSVDVDSIHTTAAVNLSIWLVFSRGVSKRAGVLTGAIEDGIGPGF